LGLEKDEEEEEDEDGHDPSSGETSSDDDDPSSDILSGESNDGGAYEQEGVKVADAADEEGEEENNGAAADEANADHDKKKQKKVKTHKKKKTANGKQQKKKKTNDDNGKRVVAKPGAGAFGDFIRLTDDWESKSQFPKNTVPNMGRLFRIIDRIAQKRINEHLEDNDATPIGGLTTEERKLGMAADGREFLDSYMVESFSEILRVAGDIQDDSDNARLSPGAIRDAIKRLPHLAAFDMELLLQRHPHMAPFINTIILGMQNTRDHKEKKNTVVLNYEHTIPDFLSDPMVAEDA
jgi:hypothetical protein